LRGWRGRGPAQLELLPCAEPPGVRHKTHMRAPTLLYL
jgi:hypothetical protein